MEKASDDDPPAGCLACRLTSGSVLVACGVYIGYHASELKKSKNAAMVIATGAGVIGVLRLLNLLPHMD